MLGAIGGVIGEGRVHSDQVTSSSQGQSLDTLVKIHINILSLKQDILQKIFSI